MAARENVALFDQSTFNKFLVQGADTEQVLQHICANDVSVSPGRIVYTQWLNERGGIESDLTVTRLEEESFLIVTGTVQGVRDLAWLKRHIPAAANVTVTDVTSGEAVLSIMGPKSREVMSKLTRQDLSNQAFPFGTAKQIEMGYAHARAHRISYVGELGWELYIPSEFARCIFDSIIDAGREFGIKLAGTHAIDSLRSEKAFRHWGHDIGDEDTPIEAGLGFVCKLNTEIPFIGREALLAQKKNGVTQRLVSFLLEDPEPICYHNEPIWRDGVIVGQLTSGSYGHALGGAVGMGYVSNKSGVDAGWVNAGSYEIQVAGKRYSARASLSPFYDPKSKRVKS